jgi:Tol biopolymer transport system component
LNTGRTDDIYTVSIDHLSSEPIGSPRQVQFRRTGRNVAPAWSPDGKYLAFVSGSSPDPNQRSVVLLPNGAGEPREFFIPTTQFTYDLGPYDLRWFGNSTGLGFSGLDAKGRSVVFRLTLATGEWTTYPHEATGIEWNGNGSRYYYAHRIGGDAAAIVEHDLESGSERTVFKGNGEGETIGGLKISPDRRALSFSNSDGTRRRLMVVDIATGQARVVLDGVFGTSTAFGPSTWLPDGRALLTLATVNRVQDLRLIPIDGGEVRRIPLSVELTRFLSPYGGAQRSVINALALSADGSRLAFVVGAARLDTWLIENPLAIAGAPGNAARR